MSNPLGRIPPGDRRHVEGYPLTALPHEERPANVPVVLGINWYVEFDRPEKDSQGRYWVARDGRLTSVRGGHCVCLEPASPDLRDSNGWYGFYDQGDEGACVGFGSSRMMSLLNRKRYFARWLWDEAKRVDEWPDTNPGDDNGTSVRAAMDVLRTRGHVPWSNRYASMNDSDPGDAYPRSGLQPVAREGISANRWATTVGQVLDALGIPAGRDHVTVLNSWGKGYPHRVRMPFEVLARLLREDGEAAIVTDR